MSGADPSSPFEILRRVAGILDDLGVAYAVGGSLASSAFGSARLTRDADLIVDLQPWHCERLVTALEPEFYVSPDAMRDAVARRDTFNAIHLDSGFKIDFFVLGSAPFDQEEFRRRRPLEGIIEGPPLFFKTPEDTLLRKLAWFRSGREVSERQWEDVLGILVVARGRLDESHLDRWAAELGVADLLERARVQARSVET